MPVLTKDQVLEAVFELSREDQEEVRLRLAERARPLHLTEDQKRIVLDELAEFDRAPESGVSWRELKERLQAGTA